jgi:acyl dehydratase
VALAHAYEVTAHNTATASNNKIHDDAVARDFGFAGGLVPGVDVYAYLTHVPADTWGIEWLERGTMRARFVVPVYEGERVRVVPGQPVDHGDSTVLVLELRGPDGGVRAEAEATLPAAPPATADVADWPAVDEATDPPPAAPEALTPGTSLGLAPHRFRADRAAEYLTDVREGLTLYAEHGVAHPGWMLRDANYVLSRNVRLGPWIHVESAVQHHDIVSDGDEISARALVTREWERKGHRFVELDVALVAHDERLLARVAHTAIYRPRRRRVRSS